MRSMDELILYLESHWRKQVSLHRLCNVRDILPPNLGPQMGPKPEVTSIIVSN